MHNLFFLTCASLLFIPGPTNILIFNSGYSNGFNKAPSLMLSEWSGYIISITLWSIAAGLFLVPMGGWISLLRLHVHCIFLFFR